MREEAGFFMRRQPIIIHTADLTKSPKITHHFRRRHRNPAATTWVTHPDGHGNALLMVYRQLASGVLQDSHTKKTHYDCLVEAYQRHQGLIDQLKSGYADKSQVTHNITKDIKKFKRALAKLTVADTTLSIRFLGDLLADRGANDYFTLLVLNHLRKCGIDYHILLSNHDVTFLEAFEKHTLIERLHCHRYVDSSATPIKFSNSFENLQVLLKNGIINESDITYLIEKSYKPYLQLITYDITDDKIAYYTHAPVDQSVIADMVNFLNEFFHTFYKTSKNADITYQDTTPEEFCDTLDLINNAFQKCVRDDMLATLLDVDHQKMQEFRKHFPEMESEIDDNKILYKHAPLHAFLWSRVNQVMMIDQATLDHASLTTNCYQWPTTDWKSNMINEHGHAGENNFVRVANKSNGLFPAVSTHFRNHDSSCFGKSTQHDQGTLIMVLSSSTRRCCPPIPSNRLK